jgi:hypothetical protein
MLSDDSIDDAMMQTAYSQNTAEEGDCHSCSPGAHVTVALALVQGARVLAKVLDILYSPSSTPQVSFSIIQKLDDELHEIYGNFSTCMTQSASSLLVSLSSQLNTHALMS